MKMLCCHGGPSTDAFIILSSLFLKKYFIIVIFVWGCRFCFIFFFFFLEYNWLTRLCYFRCIAKLFTHTHMHTHTYIHTQTHTYMSERKLLSRVQFFATQWPIQSMEFCRPGQNTGVGSYSLLQGIFPTQGSNPGLPRCRQILYHLSHSGSPSILEWVTYPFSRGSSRPRTQTEVSHMISQYTLHQDIEYSFLCYTLWTSQVVLVVKNSPDNAGDIRDVGSIPGLGRSPGEGNGNPLQYSCLGNPIGRGARLSTIHEVAKSQTQLK